MKTILCLSLIFFLTFSDCCKHVYIDRNIYIYWYYYNNSNSNDDSGVGDKDDDNNGNRVVRISQKSEIWEQTHLFYVPKLDPSKLGNQPTKFKSFRTHPQTTCLKMRA